MNNATSPHNARSVFEHVTERYGDRFKADTK